MKIIQIILLIALISQIEAGFLSDCKCDSGYYMDQNLKKCRKNPTIGHPKYQASCKDYVFNTADNLPICFRCNPDSIILLDDNNKCIKHTYENCIFATRNSENPSLFGCNECKPGHYTNNKLQRCVPNPTSGQPGYEEHCEKYYLYDQDGAPECTQCAPGKYKHHLNHSCLDPEDVVSGCYRYRQNGECEECLSGYDLPSHKTQCLSSIPLSEGDKVEGCAKYKNTGSGFECRICKDHFKLSMSENKCEKVNFVVDNCIFYGSLDMCTQCKDITHYTPELYSQVCEECPPRTSFLEAAGSDV